MHEKLSKIIQHYKFQRRPICFRVTRSCNAKCSFCLAPNDGLIISKETLFERIHAIHQLGLKTIDICGGEPTLRKDLPDIIEYVRSLDMIPTITTNGIHLTDELLKSFLSVKVVKISVHGRNKTHDDAVGIQGAFEKLSKNIDKMIDANVRITVQTVARAGKEKEIDEVIDFCKEKKIKTLRIAPFVPRGDGLKTQESFTLSKDERKLIVVKTNNSICKQGIDIRWLNFSQPMLIVETNGNLIFAGTDETKDVDFGKIANIMEKIS